MAAQPPPQEHTKGQRRALDVRWLEHLTAGGNPGDGQQLAELVSFRNGVWDFNQGRFFDAHESFERAWRETPYPERLLSLALSKLGAAFAHAQRGNLTTATQIVRDAQRCLAPLPPAYAGIDIAQLRNELAPWLASPQPGPTVIHITPVNE